MRAALLVADHIAAHPDGTFSLIRGGIDQVLVPPNTPAVLSAHVLARITVETSECGIQHAFEVRVINEDGALIGGNVSGAFTIEKGKRAANVIVGINLVLPKVGRYEVSILINSEQRDVWPIAVSEQSEPRRS
jgi:hypothetical protein